MAHCASSPHVRTKSQQLITANNMTTKLYCYVDESGQDTNGLVFVVSVVAVPHTIHADLLQTVADIEIETRKHRKWSKTRKAENLAYIRLILAQEEFKGRLYFGLFRDVAVNRQADLRMKAEVVAAISRTFTDARMTVFLDGEQKRPAEVIGAMLKALGVSVEKVRTIRREDTNAFARLADAVCGLTRDAETDADAREVFSQACRKSVLIDTRKG